MPVDVVRTCRGEAFWWQTSGYAVLSVIPASVPCEMHFFLLVPLEWLGLPSRVVGLERTYHAHRFITRLSLVRAKGEVFVLLYVFLFAFLSTISPLPAGRFTPNFACGRTLVPDLSSPFWGLAAPGGGKRGKCRMRMAGLC